MLLGAPAVAPEHGIQTASDLDAGYPPPHAVKLTLQPPAQSELRPGSFTP